MQESLQHARLRQNEIVLTRITGGNDEWCTGGVG